jgi:hypothetical protein
MRYKVTTTAQAVWHIYVEANSADEAKDKVLNGEYDEKYDKVYQYIDENVEDVICTEKITEE